MKTLPRIAATVLGLSLALSPALVKSAATAADPTDPALAVTEVAGELSIPWDLAFLPDGSMLYTQRDAKAVTLVPADGQPRVVLDSPAGMWNGGETGLMGIDVAYDFATTHDFFTCHGYRSGTTKDVRVVRWHLNDDMTTATLAKTLVTGLPSTSGRHAGCALVKGAGQILYIGTGDAATGKIPQDLNSGGGKTLRVDSRTGAGWSTNPFHTSSNTMKRRVWTFGHRNVQGLTKRSDGALWSIEQGSYRDDEVNWLHGKGDYGWNPVPRKSGDPSYNESVPMTDTSLKGAQQAAKWKSGGSTIATSAGAFVYGSQWGSLNGAMAVAALKDQSLRFLMFDSSGKLLREKSAAELDGTVGRLRAAVQGPDGSLYVTTSNSTATTGPVDKILRITPEEG